MYEKEKEYPNQAQDGQAMGMRADCAVNQCQRELTPKEILMREIDKRANELRRLESLYKALPDELIYPAQSVLRDIFVKVFSQ